MPDTDREWPDPPTTRRTDIHRVGVRVGCSVVVAAILVAVFWDFLLATLPLFWPPQEPFSRWVTFLMLQALGFVFIPLSIGSFVGDRLYDRYY
ncbi:hypothetical protein [Haloarchaeobius sp. TZWSO28]|uniref:hypothetical protein n=1 Tax=unclassified Haloarchaeobius TaxID=2614452 RepID=UPI003EC06E12